MKNKLMIIIASAAIVSCAKTGPEFRQEQGQSQTVTVKVAPFIGDDTKSTISTDGDFVWTSGDKFGVYPLATSIGAEQTSQQIGFQIQESAVGTQNGLFTGTGWGLVIGGKYKYFSYYPYDKDADYDNVVVTYPSKYTIAENSSTAHIHEDYLVAPVVTPTTPSDATFNFYHMGALVNFKLLVPAGDRSATFGYMEISCSNAVFATKGYYDPTELSIAGNPAEVTYPTFTATETVNKIKLCLGNVAPDANGYINAYLMLPQTTLNGESLEIILYGNNGKVYSCERDMTGNLQSGKKYSPSFTMVEDPKAAINLSEQATANCYVVNQGGIRYKFDCKVRGNGVDPITSDSEDATISGYESAQITWETVNTAAAPTAGTVIRNVFIDKVGGFVYFDIPANMLEGNALISIKDASDKIIWSWHIWITSADLNSLAVEYCGVTAMDRNLGALSATKANLLTLGLHYQWGRPWPLRAGCVWGDGDLIGTTNQSLWTDVSTSEETGTLAYSAENPTQAIKSSPDNPVAGNNWYWNGSPALWNATKTMYDPCPAGWKVPDCSVWTYYEFTSNFSWTTRGRTLSPSGLYMPGNSVPPGFTGLYWSVSLTDDSSKAKYFYFTTKSQGVYSINGKESPYAVRPYKD